MRVRDGQGRVMHNGFAIRAFRQARGMRGVELARQVGMSASSMCNIEAERRGVRPEVLCRVATALGVPVQALVRTRPFPGWVRKVDR